MLSAQRETESNSISSGQAYRTCATNDYSRGSYAAAVPMTTTTATQDITTAATSFATASRTTNLQFACLYTKHKTQKRKIWQDGRLVLFQGRAILHDANPPAGSSDPAIDQCELTLQSSIQQQQASQSQLVEMEKHLVTVEGPWNHPTRPTTTTAAAAVLSGPSHGMRRVLTKKFQVPAKKPPNPPQALSSTSSFLARRKRPLQPGELQRQFYGVATTDFDGRQQQYAPAPQGYHTSLQPPGTSIYQQHSLLQQQQHLYPSMPQQPGYQQSLNRSPRNPTPAPPNDLAQQNQRQQQQQQLHVSTTAGSSFLYQGAQRPTLSGNGLVAPGHMQHAEPPHQQQEPATFATQNNNALSNEASLHKKQRPTIFHDRNGFDPDSFYGEDDSDDDQGQQQPPQRSPFSNPRRHQQHESSRPSLFQINHPAPPTSYHERDRLDFPPVHSQPSPFRIEHQESMQPSSQALRLSQPSPFRASCHETTPPTDAPSVTDDDLLALFGAAPTKETNEFTLPDQGDSSSSEDDE